MASPNVDDLIAKLTPVVEQVGLDLDELKLSKAGKYRVLEIAIDGDNVDLDQIADASRAISDYLDESDLMGEQPYTLEVTTRGVDRPLTKRSHWSRNIGRLVKVTGDAIDATGRIKSVEGSIVVIDVNGKEKDFDFTKISKATIQVEFKKLGQQDQE